MTQEKTARGGAVMSRFDAFSRFLAASPVGRAFENPVSWGLMIAAAAALQVTLIATHTYFIDEWQALQIAVQSPDMAMLLENLTYEGHPLLWYLFLRALAALFGPYAALPLASLICGLATQYLVLFKSPFPRWARLMIVLSAFLLFEYSTISRCYALGVMLMFLTVALWENRRWVWLPIVLLPQTDFLFGVFSVMFAFMCWRDGNRWPAGVLLWLASGLFATWTVLPPDDIQTAYAPAQFGLDGIIVWLGRISSMLLPYQGISGPRWDDPLPIPFAMTMWLPFLVIVWDQTRGRALDRVMMASFLALLLLFILFIAPLMNRHTMLGAVLFMVLVWRARDQGHFLSAGFKVWLIAIAVCGLAAAGIVLSRPFDTAPQAARQVRELGLADQHWTTYPTQHAQSISALTGIQFERLGSDCMQDFIRWNERLGLNSPEEITAWLIPHAERHGTFYHLSSMSLPTGPVVQELTRIGAGYDGKRYYLYRIGDGTRMYDRELPRCVPGMNPLTDEPMI